MSCDVLSAWSDSADQFPLLQYPSVDCLSPALRALLHPFIQEADAYLQKITKDGEKYMGT